MTQPLLHAEGLSKAYSVAVLKGVELQILPGEVHALMGANGAGKSTLCNILAGQLASDSGTITFKNIPYHPDSVKAAESAGVRMVMQELQLVENLTVAENIFLADLPQRAGFIQYELINRQTKALLNRFGLDDIDPQQQLGSLGIGQQQLVEIARALNHQCDLLILDEPTAALNEEQVELLFAEISKLKNNGTAIIYVSHRMDEIARIADQVTVLRDGIAVASKPAGDVSNAELIRLMTGIEVDTDTSFDRRQAGPLAIRIENLSTSNKLSDISLDVFQGEILGIAGLMGSGRTEFLRAVFGADPLSEGEIKCGPELRAIAINSPVDAVKNRIGLISEDRKSEGLLLDQSILHNISLPVLSDYAGKSGWLNTALVRREVERMIEGLSVECDNSDQKAEQLSGGNQQKIIIARWLLTNCNVLLFDEPTRGIDVQTKEMIYSLLDELACQGNAVVVVSSESSELFRLSDRIAVLSDGKLAQCFKRGEWTAEAITAAAFRHYGHAEVA